MDVKCNFLKTSDTENILFLFKAGYHATHAVLKLTV